jgi:KDO2-lipid IV(A) lauroyltransferase
MRIRRDETGDIGYRIAVRDFIEAEECESQPDPLFYITARYRRALEEMVRQAPEQYLWMHRYWKSRPRFEKRGRPAPPALMEKIRQLPWMTEEEAVRIEERSARDALESDRTRA